MRWGWVLVVTVVSTAACWLVLGLVFHTQFETTTIFQRWKRPATAADRPNVWFDGTLSGPVESVCALRKDFHASKKPVVSTYLSSEDVRVAHDGEEWSVALSDLTTSSDRAATNDEIEAHGVNARAIPSGYKYRMVCAQAGDRVRIDACVGPNPSRLVPCVDPSAGELRPTRTLAAQRSWELVMRSLPLDIALQPLLMLAMFSATRWRRAGHRLLPLVPEDGLPKVLTVAAIPAVVIVVALAVLGAPLLVLPVPIVAGLVGGFVLRRAALFHAVAAKLTAPPPGMIVLEGRVGEESPLGKSSLRDELVALSLVSVARVFRGKGVNYHPVGEVQDVGMLQLATDAGTFELDLEDAVIEIARDFEVTVARAKVPAEITNSLGLEEGSEFRLQESVLRRGDRITVLVAGSKAQARDEAASAYRSAAKTSTVDVPAHARPAIFEGSVAEARASLYAKSRGFEIWAGLAFGVGLAVAVWALRVALLG